MNNRSLGSVLKEAREKLGMTQRALADQTGVEPSHIAYIEHGTRRPSLSLVKRIADALGLNRRELLFLAHPDARELVDDIRKSPLARRKEAWRRFCSNRAMLRRHKVTPAELKLLKHVSLVEHVSYPRHFIFVLNCIRQAGVSEDD